MYLPAVSRWIPGAFRYFAAAPSILEADFDLDADVDGNDLMAWQRGKSPIPMSQSDLDDWQASFGSVASSVADASTAVPEPTARIMLMLGFSEERASHPDYWKDLPMHSDGETKVGNGR